EMEAARGVQRASSVHQDPLEASVGVFSPEDGIAFRARKWRRKRGRSAASAQSPTSSRTGTRGGFQMNQRATCVGYAVRALAILATAFALTDPAAQTVAAGQGNGPPFKVICCIPEDGTLECGQLTPANCARHPGATNLGPGSCAHNPCC